VARSYKLNIFGAQSFKYLTYEWYNVLLEFEFYKEELEKKAYKKINKENQSKSSDKTISIVNRK